MSLPARVLAAFPGIVESECLHTSPEDRRYNCIAHAAGDHRRWWQPEKVPHTYWPKGILRTSTLDAYEAAFGTLGYVRCANDSLEPGLEKVAIFMNPTKGPTHAARQLEDGTWTSKLGPLEDIGHPLRQVEGHVYGVVATFMSRPRKKVTSP